MGFGLPAAMGVKVAIPDEEVICISGDSSFQMNLQELATLTQFNIHAKTIIINNGWQGMVRQWQEAFYGERYSNSNMEAGMPPKCWPMMVRFWSMRSWLRMKIVIPWSPPVKVMRVWLVYRKLSPEVVKCSIVPVVAQLTVGIINSVLNVGRNCSRKLLIDYLASVKDNGGFSLFL